VAFHLGTGTVAQATAEAIAEDPSSASDAPPQAIVLASTGIVALASGAVLRAIPESRDHPLPVQIARAGALKLSGGAVAGAVVTASDMGMRKLGLPSRPVFNVLAAGAIGATVATISVWQRDRRAESMGIDGESRKQVERPKGLKGMAAALGMGVAGAGGLLGVAGLEFVVAEGTTRLVTKVLRRDEEVTPLVGHAVALAGMTVAGGYALEQVRRRVQHQDDVVEPAYPEPPRSPYVSAGPRSEVSFHEIGKEGRRFVTMATTAEQISEVMGAPAVDPVRVVAGYESSREIAERAALAVNELDRLGGFERKAILVAAPTGVGYVNYVVIEALEYLMRGDVATVVPQYALVPSALALDSTQDAVELQRLVLEGISRRLASMPDARRPRLWQFGESLGAQVALDVVGDATTAKLLELGVERGLYLGVPFRSRTWERWFEHQGKVDPGMLLTLVSQPDDVDAATAAPPHGRAPRRPGEHVQLRRRGAPALVARRAGDPPAAGAAGDALPAGDDVRPHARRPQERHELQAGCLRAPGPRLPHRRPRRAGAGVRAAHHPRAGRGHRGADPPQRDRLGRAPAGGPQVRPRPQLRAQPAPVLGCRPGRPRPRRHHRRPARGRQGELVLVRPSPGHLGLAAPPRGLGTMRPQAGGAAAAPAAPAAPAPSPAAPPSGGARAQQRLDLGGGSGGALAEGAMLVSLPALAQRVTVLGSTRNMAATSDGVSRRSGSG
jgi:hypothetical protein